MAEQSPHELLASIPGWQSRPAKLIPLQGGLRRRSYRVDSAGHRYVLRIAGNRAVAGGGRPDVEARVQQRAAAQGLAAAVLYADAGRGLLLTEYLQGDVLSATKLSARDTLVELGALLRELHALPPCGVYFDPAAAAEIYLVEMPGDKSSSATARQCLRIINETSPPDIYRVCHNDVIAGNLVQSDTLKLIDFEYACDNDPLFDLASAIGWHNLGDRAGEWLLDAYAGGITGEMRERLRIQCRLFDALQWLWLAAHRPQASAAAQMALVQQRLA